MIFEKITFTWGGQDYVLPAESVLRTIAQVEDVITLGELAPRPGRLPLAKISIAFGIALRAAGVRVTDEEVYNAMFGDARMVQNAVAALGTLQMLMIPPEHLRAKDPKPGKPEAASAAGSSPLATGS